MLATKVEPDATRVEAEQPVLEPTWQTVVWDDPVNLMSYVSYVFQMHFGFEADQAEQLMLQVHHRGKAVVAEGSRETMEMHVEAMHSYGLWATVQQAGGS
ncbi:ATP-dependent Clp protease adapter ClpS [Leucobacter coleopterorum]|uniref:ATP-dependent Clp protease adapter protein ClpS n=1 Tax=Leucobacter coleopterorum TaxID=2714933 RepID=A0ABX6K0P8_9MICO|nr:ATP-dependent Clp protease adapter ClpS [Leucobacter coleopterorum]QIM18645.1 ATP-dependent Clp protease adapter ClpS [Leucobacter coleopterorum]